MADQSHVALQTAYHEVGILLPLHTRTFFELSSLTGQHDAADDETESSRNNPISPSPLPALMISIIMRDIHSRLSLYISCKMKTTYIKIVSVYLSSSRVVIQHDWASNRVQHIITNTFASYVLLRGRPTAGGCNIVSVACEAFYFLLTMRYKWIL